MKKTIIVVATIAFLCHSTVKGQNPYYDALKLRQYVNADGDLRSTQDTVYFILDNYIEPGKKNTIHEIDSILRKKPDPFFSLSGSIRSMADDNRTGSFVHGLLNKAGGVNVTNIADGIAKFLIERAKQELSIAFFREFREKLEDDEYRHLRTLFPNTTDLLRTIGTDIYRFSAYLQALRDAFIKDLNNLFDAFPQAIRDGLLSKAFDKAKPSYLKEIFIYALQIAKGLKDSRHPGEIIENLNLISPDPTKQTLADINAVLSVTKLFSASLKTMADQPKEYWIAKDSIRQMIADVRTFKIYLGLIYQQADGIRFSDSSTFQSHMAVAINTLKPYEDLVEDFIEKFQNIKESIGDIKDKSKSEVTYSEYYKLFGSIIEFFKINEDIERLPGVSIKFPEHYKTFINVANNSNQLYLDISLKNYTTGVMRLVAIYDTILKAAYDNYVPVNNNKLISYSQLREKIIKYGTFIASIAEAQNSDEVKAAIEAAVLPVGSSSIKRESCFNISLNSFIGPFAGEEYLPKLKEKQWSFTTGVTAPIGVAFSWGKLKGAKDVHKRSGKKIGGKSLSLFIPLIDLGAMAAFRLSNDSSNVASEVKLKNIISPGLYVYYGLGKCPLSIGIGGQIGPQLRDIDAKNINIDKNFYIRFGLNIMVDIPFFNFYTKNN